MNVSDFPRLKEEKIMEEACDKLSAWIEHCYENEIGDLAIIGILDLYKSVVINTMLDEFEEEI